MGKVLHQNYAGEAMLMDERRLGRRIAVPGQFKPFRLDPRGYKAWPCVSYDDKHVFIIAILAERPGLGLLRKLIAAIRRSGRIPIIVEPMGVVVPAYIIKHGWIKCDAVCGDPHRPEYRPNDALREK